ncbi:uncharacterized protein LOC126880241 [Diabrotica virgifera virgifera]|uniref:Vacuolar ATPase assembly integral membrane protein VMA21 homolog n=1 Tax=Diabrotica virgifera virgifera TaxID=50390 RepID=A0ABM5JPV6_DIAVI|nr:uncharacterized protein LOC126880241 [Diabrotica virgifera virgifera]
MLIMFMRSYLRNMADQSELRSNELLLPLQTKQAAIALGKLMFFSVLMFTLPFVAFFGTKYILQEHFDVIGFTNTVWSVLFSVVTVNLIIVAYAYIAYLEPDYDEKGNVKEESRNKKQM